MSSILDTKSPVYKREIICSFGDCGWVRQKYPKRKIIPDANAPVGRFYYFGREGRMRVCYRDGKVLAYTAWDATGFPIEHSFKQLWPRVKK